MTIKTGNLKDDEAAFRSIRAQLAANSRWAREPDRTAATAPARRAADDRWLKEVDPEGVLDPRERALRAQAAKRAHFARMALKSAEIRRARRRPNPDAA